MSTVAHSLTNEIIGQWTKENFLEIPSDIIGKKVNAKQNLKKYENYYINSINPEMYQVTISEKFDKKGGWVINFENITLIWYGTVIGTFGVRLLFSVWLDGIKQK